jgi:hypothetical protein
MHKQVRNIVAAVDCFKCEAFPGEPCRSPKGKQYGHVHNIREVHFLQAMEQLTSVEYKFLTDGTVCAVVTTPRSVQGIEIRYMEGV